MDKEADLIDLNNQNLDSDIKVENFVLHKVKS